MERGLGTVMIVLVGTIMVGLGEELVIRGILFVSLRERHGELVTLLATSLLFGAAHTVGSVWAGLPPAAITFQVAFLSMTGSLYYWVRRVTGRLWVGMAIHALTDFTLYLASGEASAAEAMSSRDDLGPLTPVLVTIQTLLVALAIAGVISAAREDHRARKTRRVAAEPQA
ncbi:CPBP family intramembrane glutamic endopeptidase [Microbacterium sp. WCS2018Hpa-23]|uniref:CPBP family intramembrane glutamic endopeptidase n=1 Tax=Microbacterium sp. WCS2018Hpa-23 TaxID=3073634 RepID=UPI002883543A|nr:CPBP family intramembrane glutamic endopeptidase [Microbacterium sp. WCS2018Hpa-23]